MQIPICYLHALLLIEIGKMLEARAGFRFSVSGSMEMMRIHIINIKRVCAKSLLG